ncbi:hypothetical protein N6L24_07550 [Cognatishimia sp. SS12]|uniref:hypothetical protein n=1 Tax=Cognatishimia sp. SS12 TaxID=2979465 RepID=UPI00232F7D11|nr:hypothetical protein [Cognatishimia sp. SS12]MDC0738129.1 hypothetical protein [Cognatishimia sp. SS12]
MEGARVFLPAGAEALGATGFDGPPVVAVAGLAFLGGVISAFGVGCAAFATTGALGLGACAAGSVFGFVTGAGLAFDTGAGVAAAAGLDAVVVFAEPFAAGFAAGLAAGFGTADARALRFFGVALLGVALARFARGGRTGDGGATAIGIDSEGTSA